jgi:hypothetical protein
LSTYLNPDPKNRRNDKQEATGVASGFLFLMMQALPARFCAGSAFLLQMQRAEGVIGDVSVSG